MMSNKVAGFASFESFKGEGRKFGLSGLITSIWDFEIIGVDGKVRDKETVHNLITNEGLNAWLDIMFHASTQISTWYVVLFTTDTTILATHTYAVPGYTEANAQFDEATRVAFVEAAASGQSLTNSANKALYTANTNVTVYGAALVGGGAAATTKADVAGGGTLFAAAKFTASKSLADNEIMATTVTISLANA